MAEELLPLSTFLRGGPSFFAAEAITQHVCELLWWNTNTDDPRQGSG
jgi:hypothetical protein